MVAVKSALAFVSPTHCPSWVGPPRDPLSHTGQAEGKHQGRPEEACLKGHGDVLLSQAMPLSHLVHTGGWGQAQATKSEYLGWGPGQVWSI